MQGKTTLRKEVPYPAHYNVPLVRLLSQVNPMYAIPCNFFKTHFNIILPSMPSYVKWSRSCKLPSRTPPYTFPFCLIRSTFPAHQPNNVVSSADAVRCCSLSLALVQNVFSAPPQRCRNVVFRLCIL